MHQMIHLFTHVLQSNRRTARKKINRNQAIERKNEEKNTRKKCMHSQERAREPRKEIKNKYIRNGCGAWSGQIESTQSHSCGSFNLYMLLLHFCLAFRRNEKKNSLKMQIKISPRALNKSKIRRNTQPEFFCVSRLPSRFSCGSPEQAVKQMRRLRFHYFIFVCFFRKLFCLASPVIYRREINYRRKKKTRHAIKMSV